MIRLLADVNIAGHVDRLVDVLTAEPWKEFWDGLQGEYWQFADVGLNAGSPDRLIWQTCQQNGLILITDNRNKDREDSLEAAICELNDIHSLPVITIANVPRFRKSRTYAESLVVRLLETLLDIDEYRGTGRIFLP